MIDLILFWLLSYIMFLGNEYKFKWPSANIFDQEKGKGKNL